jgi:hypothetical protein
LWHYYEKGGIWHVAALLKERDLSGFNPKASTPKTEAFWAIVDANSAPEETELADALEALGNPEAVTIDMLLTAAKGDLAYWIRDRKNRRTIPHRLDKCGMVPVRNPDDNTDGRWKIGEKRQVVYAKKSLPKKDQILAARAIKPVAPAKDGPSPPPWFDASEPPF